MRLIDKVAVITGSASGIGYSIAERFAREGAKIVIADISAEKADEAASRIKKQGGTAFGVAVDITDETHVDQSIAKTVAAYGHVDILINNAGIQHIEALDQLSFKDWKRLLAVHLDGAFLMTRACLKEMYKAKKGGSIIYMGSVHSKEASVLKGPYVTAKHGLLGLCKVVAKEGAQHGVRANVICPGFVRTPLVDKQIPEQARALNLTEDEVIKQVFLGKTVDGEFTTLEDVAETALFLASFPSNALTGQSMVVTHGWFME